MLWGVFWLGLSQHLVRQTWLAFVFSLDSVTVDKALGENVPWIVNTQESCEGQRRDSQFPMLRHGAGVGRDRVSERTREADPLCFLGEWELCHKHLLFRRNLHYRVDIWRGLKLRLLWRWFGSWAQLIGVALSEFLGVGKDSFSCEHTLASQTSFFELKKRWEDFPKRGRSSRPPSCVFPGCGYAPHTFGTSEPRCYFSFYFLVYLGLIWQIIKWLSSWILGWQAEKARLELACTFHLTYQCERCSMVSECELEPEDCLGSEPRSAIDCGWVMWPSACVSSTAMWESR